MVREESFGGISGKKINLKTGYVLYGVSYRKSNWSTNDDVGINVQAVYVQWAVYTY